MTILREIMDAARNGGLNLRAVVITDWRDGPLEGLARLSVGDGLWKFSLFAENANSEDLDDRLFLFSELLEDSAGAGVLGLVASAQLPLVWPFDDRPDEFQVRSIVDSALGSAPPAKLIVASRDFSVVDNVWRIEDLS